MFLSSFFTWANREFNLPGPLKGVPVPKFEEGPVEPFTKKEIEALLKACKVSREARPALRRKFVMRRINVHRDRAVDPDPARHRVARLRTLFVDDQFGRYADRKGDY